LAEERVSATAVIDASAEAVFRVLADPTSHGSIDGTGWVCGALDEQPLTGAGQVFRMSMYHPKHPDGGYTMHNLVEVFDPPRAIAWKPGYVSDGELGFGGWVWRYDLEPTGEGTKVTLTYDWSAISDEARARQPFPPFRPDHLGNSLAHLADLVR
jgi:hypothetical protein